MEREGYDEKDVKARMGREGWDKKIGGWSGMEQDRINSLDYINLPSSMETNGNEKYQK